MKEGWEYKTLGEVAKVFAGGDVPKNRMSKCKKEPFIIPIYTNGIENEGLYGYTDIARVNDLSLTISARGTIGAIFKRNNPFFPAIRLITVCPQNIVDINFLYYVLLNSTFTKSGTTIPQLTVPMLKQYRFAIPENISIQQNIANYLDSSFKLIDEIKNKALKSLTEAKALFQSALAEAMEPKEGWEEKTLGECCDKINGLWKGKKPPFIYVGVIRNANFTKKMTLDFSNIEYLDVEVKQYNSRKLKRGDLIIEKSGGSEKQPVGRAVLFLKGDGEYSFSNFTSVLRIKNNEELNYYFLYYFLLYIYQRGDTKTMQKATTGIHNIEFEKYLNIKIPIMSLNEQRRIVSYLDKLSSKVQAIEEKYQKMVEECDALKQAMLRDVFE